MAENNLVKFEQLFSVQLRNGIFRPTRLRGSGTKMVNMGEIFAHSIISEISMDRVELTLAEQEKCLLEPDDLLFARSSLVLSGAGKCSIFMGSLEPVTFESHIIRVRLNKDVADPWYYYYFFNSPLGRQAIESIVEQVAAAGIRGSDLAKIPVPCPSIEQQRQVAAILRDFDFKIRINQQQNNTLEKIAQTLFKLWFNHFDFPGENGKPYKSSGGKMIESELGMIPVDWRVAKLGNHVRVIKGCSYRSVDLRESRNALVTLKSIERGGGFKADGLKPYTGEYSDEQVISAGELVVAHTDLTQKAEVLGKPAIVRNVSEFSTLVASLDLAIVRSMNTEEVDTPFLYFLLKGEEFQNHAYGFANGTTVLHLHREAIPEFKVVIPLKKIHKMFHNAVAPMVKLMLQNEEENESLSLLRNNLLPRLLSEQFDSEAKKVIS